jgi:hypothetical protein
MKLDYPPNCTEGGVSIIDEPGTHDAARKAGQKGLLVAAKMLIDIPSMNWAYTVLLEKGQSYTFGTTKANSFPLPAGTAADQHARVSHDGSWLIEDCGSSMGTYVNGNRIEKHPLKNQDLVRIGTCEAVFQNREEAAAANPEWEQTHRVAEEHRKNLEAVASKAGSGQMNTQEMERAVIGRNIGAGFAPQSVTPSMNAPIVRGKEAGPIDAQDMIWVVQKLSSIMSAVLLNPAGRDETYHLLLTHLRDAIVADNGFVVIPDQIGTKWNVRAWVGDNKGWTQYEKDHPLPMTVTNRAYRTMTVVSNAIAGSSSEPINSFSLQQLNVSSYIAIPLLDNGQRRGVMYFDTRDAKKKFTARDVRLLELAGNFILEIEALKKV